MNVKIVFGLLVILFFSGCTTLDPPIWIDDANYYSTDLNVDDANFTNLNDTPANYVGSGSQCVAVNAGETGLEFIVCASGLSDTTLDLNINALFNFLGKSYDWNKDQNFLSANVFDLNLGKDTFSVNGVDFNVFDLNTSVLNQCSGDANHVLTSANLCQFIGGYGNLNTTTLQTAFDAEGGTRIISIDEPNEALDIQLTFTTDVPNFKITKAGGSSYFKIYPTSEDFLVLRNEGSLPQFQMYSTDNSSEIWIDPSYGNITNKDYGIGGDGGLILDFYGDYVRPGTDALLSLGTPNYEWKDLWVDGNITTDGNLFVDGNAFVECLFFEDGSIICTNDFLSVDSNVDSNQVKFGVAAGSVELNDLNNLIAITQSSGYYSGGDFTDNADGSITVSSGLGLIRELNANLTEVKFFSWDENTNVSLVDEQANYIAIDYNSGLPYVRSSVSSIANGKSIFNLGLVFREATEVHLFKAGQNVINLMQRTQARINAEGNIILTSGGTVAEKNERYLTVTSAILFGGLTKVPAGAIDTNTDFNSFRYYYTDGIGGYQFIAKDSNQINNTQYDNAGTLTALTSNRYRTDWVYLCNAGHLHVILGTNNSPTLTVAQNLEPPTTLPIHVRDFATIIAKVIVREGTANLTEVTNITTEVFTSSGGVNHNDLSGLQGGTAEEYYHLTEYLNELINDFNLSVETATEIWWTQTDLNEWVDQNVQSGSTPTFFGDNITDIDHDTTLNYVANQHIDWTNASDALVTTASVGTDFLRLWDLGQTGELQISWNETSALTKALKIYVNNQHRDFNLAGDLKVATNIILDQNTQKNASPEFGNTNMTGNISVWTNDSGYITSSSDSNVWSEGFLNDFNAFNFDVNAQDRNGYFGALSIGNGVSPITSTYKRGILVGGDSTKGITLPDNQTGYRALSSEITVNTTASLNDVYGYYSGVTLKGANAVTNLIGALGKALVHSAVFTDTLTNLIGLRATVTNTGATVTNAFGLLIDDVTAGTNNYAIKTGTGLNWLGDDLNVQGDLNVSADANIMGNLFIGGDLNVLGNLHVDQNIIAESILGKAMLIPDQNMVCVGTETVFCMDLTCNAIGDCNANFKFI